VKGIHFLGPQVAAHWHRLGTQRRVQGVGKAMGGIGADHQRLVPQFGATQGGGRSHAGLPHPPFTGVNDYAQT